MVVIINIVSHRNNCHKELYTLFKIFRIMQAGASGGLYIRIIYNPCNIQDQQLVVFNM